MRRERRKKGGKERGFMVERTEAAVENKEVNREMARRENRTRVL